MGENKFNLDQNGINWNEHKPMIDEITKMVDSKNVDVQKGMQFLHMYMIWYKDYNLPINNQTMNIYYQLVGGGALAVAVEFLDKIFHRVLVKDKDNVIIVRLWPKPVNQNKIS